MPSEKAMMTRIQKDFQITKKSVHSLRRIASYVSAFVWEKRRPGGSFAPMSEEFSSVDDFRHSAVFRHRILSDNMLPGHDPRARDAGQRGSGAEVRCRPEF
jgi:hypothetical protein